MLVTVPPGEPAPAAWVLDQLRRWEPQHPVDQWGVYWARCPKRGRRPECMLAVISPEGDTVVWHGASGLPGREASVLSLIGEVWAKYLWRGHKDQRLDAQARLRRAHRYLCGLSAYTPTEHEARAMERVRLERTARDRARAKALFNQHLPDQFNGLVGLISIADRTSQEEVEDAEFLVREATWLDIPVDLEARDIGSRALRAISYLYSEEVGNRAAAWVLERVDPGEVLGEGSLTAYVLAGRLPAVFLAGRTARGEASREAEPDE